MPGTSAGEQPQQRPNQSQQVLPQIQKNQKPSTVILKYLEGITKRVSKIVDA